MPMRLDEGWNQIQFNLSDFTRRAYGTNYIETLNVQVSCCEFLYRSYFFANKVCAAFYQDACNNGFAFLFRSMRIAEYGEYISVTDCIQRTSFHQNSSCSCRLNKINQTINPYIDLINLRNTIIHVVDLLTLFLGETLGMCL